MSISSFILILRFVRHETLKFYFSVFSFLVSHFPLGVLVLHDVILKMHVRAQCHPCDPSPFKFGSNHCISAFLQEVIYSVKSVSSNAPSFPFSSSTLACNLLMKNSFSSTYLESSPTFSHTAQSCLLTIGDHIRSPCDSL